MPPPPPAESSLTGEIPPLGGYRCRAVLKRFATDPGHECGEPLVWRTGRQPIAGGSGYWQHVDPALDRDHPPKRAVPLKGTEQPSWLSSRAHRVLVAEWGSWVALLLIGLLVLALFGWVAVLVGAVLVIGFNVALGIGDVWIKRAPRA